MGNSQPKGYKPPTLQAQSWRQAATSIRHHKAQHGQYLLLINNLTNQQLEEYSIFFDSESQLHQELYFFEWREREDCIVKAKYLNYDQSKQCCTTTFRARLYVQRIPVRLSDIQDIPFPQNLYVMINSLEGFQKLYEMVGYFRVTEDLVCMDKDGRVKTWLNPDLSKCIPQSQLYNENASQSRTLKEEYSMVEEIVRLIEENSEKDQVSMTITQFIESKYKGKGLGFKQCKQQIINYANKFQIDIPNYFQSVVGLFDEEMPEESGLEERQSPQSPHFKYDQAINKQLSSNQIESNSYGRELKGEVSQIDDKILNRIPSNKFSTSRDSHLKNTDQRRYIEHAQPQYRIHHPGYVVPMEIINMTNYKVNFNYQITSPIVQNHTLVKQHSFANNNSSLQKVSNYYLPRESDFYSENVQQVRRSVNHSSLKDLLIGDKIVYSDCSKTYQLDPQLAYDMMKYLIF